TPSRANRRRRTLSLYLSLCRFRMSFSPPKRGMKPPLDGDFSLSEKSIPYIFKKVYKIKKIITLKVAFEGKI
ncbi:MAG: hypothetical protein J5832_03305, partial [Clostridia bacterium]|nr:hypothetical protein [Clostridia bacterium]